MKRKKIHVIIEILVWLLFAMVLFYLFPADKRKLEMEWPFLIAVCIYSTVVLLKGMRIYALVMEEPIELKRLINIYLRTTLITLVLPWRTGEIYRMYTYAKEFHSVKKGIAIVLVDRFFDSVPLVGILIFTWIMGYSTISIITIIILLFMILSTVFYFATLNTYKYLNQIFIKRKTTKRNIKGLAILANIKKIYNTIKALVKNRGWVLLVFSCIAWIMESIALWITAFGIGENPKWDTVFNYLNQTLSGKQTVLSRTYLNICILSVLTIFLFYGVFLCIGFLKGQRRKNE